MNVVIVGAGPAGACLARLLAQRGIDTTLVEREETFDRVFRGEGLMPSGVDALFEMGLQDVLAELPSRILASWDIHMDGQRLFSVSEPLEELGDRAVRVIPQPVFLERVVEEAARHASFHFIRGRSVRELPREKGRVSGVRVGMGDTAEDIPADLVIGCDGRASTVRKLAELDLTRLPEGYDILWFKLPAPERLRGRCSMYIMIGRAHVAACYTSWDDRLQYALTLEKGAYRERRDTDWPVEMGQPAPEWLRDHILEVRDDIEGPMVLDVIVGRCPTWSAPGLLLLGDAAHPMAPVRAQGINIAMRDAIVAANHLVPPLQSEADAATLDAAARAVQTEREPEIVRVQSLQHQDTQGLNTWAAPILMGLAKIVAPLLGRFEWGQRAWLRQQHDLRHGAVEVTLQV